MNMTVKNNPNRFAYIGCLIHSLDRSLDELASASYNDDVCELLSEEERNMLEDAYADVKQVFDSAQEKVREFGIKGENRIDRV